MKRIDTSSKSVDKFGSGKHGFTNGTPGSVAATALDATWFDHLQEEVARFIEARGGALNASAYTQLHDAIVARSLQSWRNKSPSPRVHKLVHLVQNMASAGDSYVLIPDFGDVERIDAQIEGAMVAGGATLTFYRNNVGGGLSLGSIGFLVGDAAGTVRSLTPAFNHTLLDPREFVGCTLSTSNTTACRCWLVIHYRSHFDFAVWYDASYDSSNDVLLAFGMASSEVCIARAKSAMADWERVYAANGIGYPYSAGFGNNRHVTVGSSGLILVSADSGVTWTQYSPGGSYSGSFWSVAYNGATAWVAVGSSGAIQSAGSNADSWTSRRTGAETLQSVAYSSTLGMWCVVGSGGTILTSTDLITWTARTSGTSNSLNAVIWDSSRAQFVAVGGVSATADVCTSSDGITWTKTNPATLGRAFGTLTYFNGWYVGKNSTYVMASGDGGVTWTERDCLATTPSELRTVGTEVLALCNYRIYASGNVA